MGKHKKSGAKSLKAPRLNETNSSLDAANVFNGDVHTVITGEVHIESLNTGLSGTAKTDCMPAEDNQISITAKERYWKLALISVPIVVMAIISIIAALKNPETSKTLLEFWKKLYSDLLNTMLII